MHWKQDWKSKVNDGLATTLILFVLLVLSILLVRPIANVTGRPGLLVYTLSMISLSVYCLEHSLRQNRPETSHAWYGMAGGMLGWISISLSNDLGGTSTSSVTAVLTLILFGLTVTRLWRRHLPVGGKLYSQTLLLGWIGQLILESRPAVTAWYPPLVTLYNLLVYLCILAAFLITWWVFTQTDRRLQRISAAPWLVFFLAVGIFSLWS